jgi:mono/diheme cytochrome c family protein
MHGVFQLSSSLLVLAALGCATDTEPPAQAAPVSVQGPSAEEIGRYLFLFGGCNDCHTPGWSESDGKLPEADWALGNAVGYRGPWGTSYAENLRLAAAARTERQWVQLFRQSAGLPPMPWQNYRTVAEADLVAIHRFLRSLGARGVRAPDTVPPGQEPSTPYVDFTVHMPAPRAR